ncbi:SEC10/PgrA surface exclusion domain-containing protein [Streptococcus oralis]|uniref:Cell wall-binding repeat protein n=1 Tax=Streptococcus oralis SK610 TaxID=1095741 RepID=I0Q0U4_STROR|nr:SEC10/PgrA surface exclusion domain-containing protein [Streptococcus oralis]EIC74896.1 cell wall-binding repeat protein [Streptococcus oralis SK610]
MKYKKSIAFLSTAILLAFSSVVHADSARQSKIKELDNQRSELAKKNGVTGYLGDGRWYSLVESENKVDILKNQVEALKVPYSEKNTIKVSPAYVKALKDHFDFSKSEQERDQAEEILKSESAKLALQKNDFVTVGSDEVEVYDLDNLPKEVLIELNYFAFDMINQVRRQMGTKELILAESSIDFASKLSVKMQIADRSIWDWHYVKGINEVAREYGLPTSTKEDEEKKYGAQYYENGAGTNHRLKEVTKAELKRTIYDAILEFMYNGYEYLHAQSIAGLNWGEPNKTKYFGLSIFLLKDGTQMSFITVSDEEISKSTKNNFSTKTPVNTTESNRKSTIGKKEKELESEKGKLEKLNISYKEYEKISKEIDKLNEEEEKEKEKERKAKESLKEKKGWIREGNDWYFYKNNQPIKNTWESDYWFGSDGKMVTDSWVDNGRYYVDKSGKYVQNKNQKYGWVQEGNDWYFYKNNQPIKNTWEGDYWFGSDGKMATDSWVDNGRYYVDGTGRYVQNKKPAQTKSTPSKEKQVEKNPTKPDLVPSIKKNGWIEEGKTWYFYKNNQPLKNTWQGSYFLKSDGKMAMSEWVYDSYYKAWYYLKSDGSYSRSAWQGSYYLKSNGKMAESEWIYDSSYQAWYYLKSNGVYANSAWQGSYYLKSNGKMAMSEWVYDSYYQAWFYLKFNGIYARSEWVQGYWVDSLGSWK